MQNMAPEPIQAWGDLGGNASRYEEHLSRGHFDDRDGDALALSRQCVQTYHFPKRALLRQECGPRPVEDDSAGAAGPAATCSDLLAARASAFAHTRLVLGVTTSPDKWGAFRRDGIRRTWFQYGSDGGGGVLVCFVVGRAGVKAARLEALDAEAARTGDLVFLPFVRDGDGPFVTISKAHAWFRLACESLGLISRGERRV